MRVKTIVTALTAGMIVSGSAMAASSDVDAKIANLQQQIQQLQAQMNSGAASSTSSSMKQSNGSTGGVSFVKYDANYSQKMLNNQDSGVNRELTILQSRQSGQLTPNSIYIGGRGEVQASYLRMGDVRNNNSNAVGNGQLDASNTTAIDLPYANIIFTSTIGEWVTGYANVAVTNPVTNDVVMPDAYFVLGNLDKTPVYFWGGVKTVDFGRFDMMNTYVPTLSRAAFLASGGQVGFGYHDYGVTSSITLLNGSEAGSMNTSNNASNHQISNFAANVSYANSMDNFNYQVGAGYINGTGFHGGSTAADTQDRVGAWTVNAGFDVAGFAMSTDFAMTTSSVKGLNTNSALQPADQNSGGNPYSNANLYNLPWIVGYTTQMGSAFNSGKPVKSWDLNGSYSMPVMGHDTVFFGTYSQLAQDTNNNMYQFGAGARTNVIDTVWVGLSYNFTGGKLNSNDLQSSNLILADATVYF